MLLDDLIPVEKIARRAPSPHNTQPWRLIYGQNRVRLDYDPLRHLKASDANHRDLLLSLGGYVEALMIAASEAGIGLHFIPDLDLERHRIGWFVPAQDVYPTIFTSDDIIRRRTSRLPYRPVPLGAGLYEEIHSVLSPADRVVFLAGSTVRDLLGEADRRLLDVPEVASEFRRWSRLKPAEIASSEDGMTAACLALGRTEAQVLAGLLSERVYPWFRRLNLSTLLAGASRGLVKSEAQLVALVRRAGDPFATLDAGRSLLRVWLTFTRAGLYAQPLSQVLDCPRTSRILSQRLAVARSDEVLCLLRFGASREPARSRRLGESTTAVRPSVPARP